MAETHHQKLARIFTEIDQVILEIENPPVPDLAETIRQIDELVGDQVGLEHYPLSDWTHPGHRAPIINPTPGDRVMDNERLQRKFRRGEPLGKQDKHDA